MTPRKICFVTGSRAEFGLISELMKAVEKESAFELHLIVTGAHLADHFGHTIDEIIADGFKVDSAVDLNLDGDSRLDTARYLGRAVEGVAEALDQLSPDLLFLSGDRYEMFAAPRRQYAGWHMDKGGIP